MPRMIGTVASVKRAPYWYMLTPGTCGGERSEVRDTARRQRVGAHHRHAIGHGLQRLRAARRRDGHFLELRGLLLLVGGGGGRSLLRLRRRAHAVEGNAHCGPHGGDRPECPLPGARSGETLARLPHCCPLRAAIGRRPTSLSTGAARGRYGAAAPVVAFPAVPCPARTPPRTLSGSYRRLAIARRPGHYVTRAWHSP